MPDIQLENLQKIFRTFSRREGVWGSMKDLFQRDYRDLRAVDGISFSVEAGELIGYIGPNGAGKSTSIKMLTGILKPSGGSMKVLGFDPFEQRKQYTKHIGVVFGQRTQLWWDIAVIESLRLLGKIYEVPDRVFEERLARLREILGLDEILNTPVRKVSLGQRIRADLAASLIHQPRVLFLDEPTIGLDAVAKQSIRAFLKQINKEFRTTIILTTHDLKEIEELCERMIILDHGKIVYDGSLEAIKTLPGLKRELHVDFSRQVEVQEFKNIFGERAEFQALGPGRILAKYDQQVLPTIDLTRELFAHFPVADLTINEPDIEDVIRKVYLEGIEAPVR